MVSGRLGNGALSAALVCVGLYVVYQSRAYEIGTILQPGAGFWPLCMGSALTCLSALLFFPSLRRQGDVNGDGDSLSRQEIAKLCAIAACLLLWVPISSLAGWLTATCLLTFVLSKLFGLRGHVMPLILAIAVTGMCYLLFGVLFYTDLPSGSLF